MRTVLHGGAPVLLAAGLAAASSCAPADEQPAITWEASVEVAMGGGQRGPWRQNASEYDYVDDPTVAVDAHGAAAVAWVDQRHKDVFFQSYERDGKPRHRHPVNVSRSPEVLSWLPRLVLSPVYPCEVYVLWQEMVFSGGSHGGDIYFARSRDGGASFSQPLNLSLSTSGDGKGRINKDVWHNGSLDLAIGRDGTLYAAWTEYDGPLWFSRSNDGGESSSKPRRRDRGGEQQLQAQQKEPHMADTESGKGIVGFLREAPARTSTALERSGADRRISLAAPGRDFPAQRRCPCPRGADPSVAPMD